MAAVAAAQILLTFALVMVTAYYAYQTRRTAEVMEESIRAQQRPHLVMQMMRNRDPSGGWCSVSITNEGFGPAIDAQLAVTFHPATRRRTQRRDVRVSLIAGDTRVEVIGPEKSNGSPLSFDELCRDFDRIELCGSVVDSLGERIEVDYEIRDLRPFARHDEVGFHVRHDRLIGEVRHIAGHLGGMANELAILRQGLREKAAETQELNVVPF